MKKLLILMLAVAAASCVEKPEAGSPEPPVDVDIDHFQTAETFDVPVKAGSVTIVKADGVTIAEADSPLTIWVPRMNRTRAEEGVSVEYVPVDEYPGFTGNKAQMFQVICFEDSYEGDYDYNDLVIHVLYQQKGNIFGFGVQPIALGSAKSIQLGCTVYKGATKVFDGLITPEGKDCREQYFKSIEGFINVNNRNEIDFTEPNYLASTCRNWDLSKIAGTGAPRVEWFIEAGGKRIYALSTAYLNQSFDKSGLPLGLVITTTGTVYTENGYECGFDWFNYPHESVHIRNVYPQVWEWLSSDKAYSFSEFYDGYNPPKNAYRACDNGLFKVPTTDVTLVRFRQN